MIKQEDPTDPENADMLEITLPIMLIIETHEPNAIVAFRSMRQLDAQQRLDVRSETRSRNFPLFWTHKYAARCLVDLTLKTEIDVQEMFEWAKRQDDPACVFEAPPGIIEILDDQVLAWEGLCEGLFGKDCVQNIHSEHMHRLSSKGNVSGSTEALTKYCELVGNLADASHAEYFQNVAKAFIQKTQYQNRINEIMASEIVEATSGLGATLVLLQKKKDAYHDILREYHDLISRDSVTIFGTNITEVLRQRTKQVKATETTP